jgi:hypothetical protein
VSLETQIRRGVATWRELMGRRAVQAQQILRKILVGPIVFALADVGGEAGYGFKRRASVVRLLTGLSDLLDRMRSTRCMPC